MNVEVLRKYVVGPAICDYEGSRYKPGGMAVIGQDPGITTTSKVNSVLMLNDEGSELYNYISKHILSPIGCTVKEIVAFNLINTHFSTSIANIAKQEKYPFYKLIFEIANANENYPNFLNKLDKYVPSYIITLGKPVFEFLKKKSGVDVGQINEVFAKPITIRLNTHSLVWLPCVHIRTYKVYNRVYWEQDTRLKSWAKGKDGGRA